MITIRSPRRGFTIVELMMALALFAVGVTGLVAMQLSTTHSNRIAKDLATATQLARTWQERLTMDGNLWGGPNAWTIDNTVWLDLVQVSNATWVLPTASGTFGPSAGSRGEPVALADAYFCTHIRLTRLLNETGAGLIRSEVRVFFPKGPVAWSGGDPYCVGAADVADIGSSIGAFYFVYATSVVRETPKF